MNLNFSFIIPVFNRPVEIEELLQSMSLLRYNQPFEIVIIEDGSIETSLEIVKKYRETLKISYYNKPNSGPGDSRNFGMKKATGNYFLILDSDVLLPSNYLEKVDQFLSQNFVHCFGGPDDAHPDFDDLQKAISFSMTSFLTTGGIRGKKNGVGTFQPRSFNMGLSREAFEASGGFGQIHPGEDPDLVIRLWKMGYQTALIPEAKVFHKRRISWKKFYTQVYKFGLVRPILNSWHPETAKITYWFPAFFMISIMGSIILAFVGYEIFLIIVLIYLFVIFLSSILQNKKVSIGLNAVIAVLIQFFGYGTGFLQSYYYIQLLKRKPEEQFKQLFFKK